jgi:hypothetical protein
MPPVAIDIETVPTAAALALAEAERDRPYPEGERTPPAAMSKAETIAAWYEKDRANWKTSGEERFTAAIKAASLNPRLGRVAVLGYATSIRVGAYEAQDEADEATVLRSFWEMLKGNAPVVTWNGAFDLRFLVIRSIAHGVAPTVDPTVWFRRYSYHPHFDCKAVLLNWDVRVSGEGLDEWAKFLGLAGKTDGITGADVFPLWQAGRYDEVTEYCKQDAALTLAIYDRIHPYY